VESWSRFVQELGPKLEILYWHALFAPAGTPDAIVDKLNSALQEIMADQTILRSWADTGVAPYPKDQRSPAAARALLGWRMLDSSSSPSASPFKNKLLCA
jgi:hypothetical protein